MMNMRVNESAVEGNLAALNDDAVSPNSWNTYYPASTVNWWNAIDLSGLRAAIVETHPQWIGPEGINKVMRAFMDAGLAYYHRGSHGKVLAFRSEW